MYIFIVDIKFKYYNSFYQLMEREFVITGIYYNTNIIKENHGV